MRSLVLVLCLWPALAWTLELDALRKAAEQGDAQAQLNLGAAYDKGLGVTPDDLAAERWYRRAAEQGLAEAQFNLGHLLVSSGRDAAEGAHWMIRAAEQGLADAQYLAGVIYAEGIGVEPDRKAARRWLRQAAQAGHQAAVDYLAENPFISQ